MAVSEARDTAGAAEVLAPAVLVAYLAAGATVGATAAVAATAAAAPCAAAAAVVAGAAAAAATRAWAAARGAGPVGAGGKVAAAEVWNGKKIPTDPELFNLYLSLKIAGETDKAWPTHVHKVNVFSASPRHLFNRYQPHAPGKGHGKEDASYFYSQAAPKKGKKGVKKRDRRVVGGGIWHSESCLPIHGTDGSVVGNKRRFSYQVSGSVSTGWILFEFSPKEEEDGVDQMVFCSIHRSNRNNPETSTAASSSSGAETPSIEQGQGRDESLGSPGGGMQSTAQLVPAVLSVPALGIHPADTTDLLPQPQAEDFNEHILNGSTLPDTSHDNGYVSEALAAETGRPVRVNSSSSGAKRNADQDLAEAPERARQRLTDMDRSVLQGVELRLFSDDNLMPDGVGFAGYHYEFYKDILNNLMPTNADGDSARFDDGMTSITEEYPQEPIGLEDVGDWDEQQRRAEMMEGGRAPRGVLEETGHRDWKGLDDFAPENSARRSLHGSGTELVAAEPDVDDGADDVDWFMDYTIENVETQLGFD